MYSTVIFISITAEFSVAVFLFSGIALTSHTAANLTFDESDGMWKLFICYHQSCINLPGGHWAIMTCGALLNCFSYSFCIVQVQYV